MGVDLTLLPVDWVTKEGDFVCLRSFDLDRNCVIDKFSNIKRYPISGRVYWPIEPMPAEVQKLMPTDDPITGGPLQGAMFGWATEQDLRYVYAKDIRQAFENLREGNDYERAAIAYISNLFDRTEVILYWW